MGCGAKPREIAPNKATKGCAPPPLAVITLWRSDERNGIIYNVEINGVQIPVFLCSKKFFKIFQFFFEKRLTNEKFVL